MITAWFVPERWWLPITRALGRATVRLAVDRTGEGMVPASSAMRDVVAERIATGHASRLYGLREYRPGPRPRVQIELVGVDHLRRALDEGNGAILWVARFAFAPLFAKTALQEAGFAVTHLSRPTHGFDASPFAVRWLNPVWTRIEERHVHERIVMRKGAETTAMRTLRRRLAANGIVSITVGDEAARTVEVPVGDETIRLATGPGSLAAASGAALLPLFVVRRDDGSFVATIESPIDTRAADREALFRSVAEEYASRLAPHVRDYPGQWIP